MLYNPWTVGLQLDALVVCQLDVNILAGNPFMIHTDFSVHTAKHQTLRLSTTAHPPHTHHPNVQRKQSFLLCNQNPTVVQISTPSNSGSNTCWALEPLPDCPSNMPCKPWPPPLQILSMDHAVHISNTSNSPVLLRNGEQICQS